MTMGRYRVAGTREYRGHKPGVIFEARIDRAAEARAISRGDLELVAVLEPELQPGSWELPDGWLSTEGKE